MKDIKKWKREENKEYRNSKREEIAKKNKKGQENRNRKKQTKLQIN
jgi:hypothetical protein